MFEKHLIFPRNKSELCAHTHSLSHILPLKRQLWITIQTAIYLQTIWNLSFLLRNTLALSACDCASTVWLQRMHVVKLSPETSNSNKLTCGALEKRTKTITSNESSRKSERERETNGNDNHKHKWKREQNNNINKTASNPARWIIFIIIMVHTVESICNLLAFHAMRFSTHAQCTLYTYSIHA